VYTVGLVEPLDDFKKNTVASNPQLMDFLANLMVEVKYDLKAYQRVLYNTKTYGLSTATVEVPEGSRWHFNGRPLRRMSAEQVWDSMLTLMVDDVDAKKNPIYSQEPMFAGKPMYQVQQDIVGVSAEKYWDYLEDLVAKGGGSGYMMMSGGRGDDSQLLRASELRQPASPEHFLRKFGQSDRVTIDGSNTESDVTQALSLLNGVAERAVVNNAGALIRTFLRKCSTSDQKVNMIYYSILNRVPSPEEKAPLLAELDANPGQGELTLLSAALNSVEFIFIQ
jgi:hypothetical protein